MTVRRLVIVVVALAILFAIQGGEYSTLDFLTLRREEQAERVRIARLQQEVDSLAKEAVAVETDPEVQERIARERYGMIRPGERVYTVYRDSMPRER